MANETGGTWDGIQTGASLGLQLGAAYNASKEGKEARQWASQEAWNQRYWQEFMRSSRYQTEVWDMKKAGLNPALLYQGGGGAPVPGGGMPNVPENIGNVAMNSAMAVKRMREDLRFLGAQRKKMEADGRISSAQAQLEEWKRDFMLGKKSAEELNRKGVPIADLMNADVQSAIAMAQTNQARSTTSGAAARVTNQLMGSFFEAFSDATSQSGRGLNKIQDALQYVESNRGRGLNKIQEALQYVEGVIRNTQRPLGGNRDGR